jgi:hypothetical protein
MRRCLGHQGHGTHQVLRAHNAHHAAALGNGNQRQPVSRSEPADGGAERVFRARYLESPGHHGLHVAVSFAAQRVGAVAAVAMAFCPVVVPGNYFDGLQAR